MRYLGVAFVFAAVSAFAAATVGDVHPPLNHQEIVSNSPPYVGAYVNIDDFDGDVVLVYFWKC